jgi:hypothetical protein
MLLETDFEQPLATIAAKAAPHANHWKIFIESLKEPPVACS